MYFYDGQGEKVLQGEVLSFNAKTYTLDVDGVKWRVSKALAAYTPEVALEKWDQYQIKLAEFLHNLELARNQYNYFPWQEVNVQSRKFKKDYKAVVAKVNDISLDVICQHGFMRVDKSIAVPLKSVH